LIIKQSYAKAININSFEMDGIIFAD